MKHSVWNIWSVWCFVCFYSSDCLLHFIFCDAWIEWDCQRYEWLCNVIDIRLRRWEKELFSRYFNFFLKRCYLTKLNLKNVYHCLRIQHEDEWKTTFCIHYNHFEYMIMSFNLINTFIMFQTYINKILTELLNDFYIIYLNDILIFSVEKTDHIDHVKQILKRLRKFKLYASLKKCEFFITKVNFLKFVIFIKNISMNSSRINIIKTWFRSKMY